MFCTRRTPIPFVFRFYLRFSALLFYFFGLSMLLLYPSDRALSQIINQSIKSTKSTNQPTEPPFFQCTIYNPALIN